MKHLGSSYGCEISLHTKFQLPGYLQYTCPGWVGGWGGSHSDYKASLSSQLDRHWTCQLKWAWQYNMIVLWPSLVAVVVTRPLTEDLTTCKVLAQEVFWLKFINDENYFMIIYQTQVMETKVLWKFSTLSFSTLQSWITIVLVVFQWKILSLMKRLPALWRKYWKIRGQVGTELGQAQLKLRMKLGYTLFNFA